MKQLQRLKVRIMGFDEFEEYFDNIEKIPDALNETIGKYLLQYISKGSSP